MSVRNFPDMKPLHTIILCLALLVARPGWSDFPPLTTEISPEHPLFIFQDFRGEGKTPAAYSAQIITAWNGLPEKFRPYASLLIDSGSLSPSEAHAYYLDLLGPLQEANVPVVVRIAQGNKRARYSIERLEELLSRYTTIRGVEAAGLQFNEYNTPDAAEFEIPKTVLWLTEVIDTAARYGRFTYLPIDGLNALYLLSNTNAAPLYRKLHQCRGYVIPASVQRGTGVITRNSALMGLWLEEAVAFWGIAADGDWYESARFISPGVFGVAQDRFYTPGHPFRAMVYNGAMTGATVYQFGPESSLWFGGRAEHWQEHIFPALDEVITLGLIARDSFVLDAAPIAYRLNAVNTPPDLEPALRDLDAVHGFGNMLFGLYGQWSRSLNPELILNRNSIYWAPIFSPYAPTELLNQFQHFIQPGVVPDADGWAQLATPLRSNEESEALVVRIGRAVFAMNTEENIQIAQAFRIPDLPRPLTGLVVRRENGAVTLSWPYREGDISYNVYRKLGEQPHFQQYARGLDDQRFVDNDAPSDINVSYAVTAITGERDTFAGNLNYGEYLALSSVESRITESATLAPLLSEVEAQPLPSGSEPVTDPPFWIQRDGVPDEHTSLAEAIEARFDQFRTAVAIARLDDLMRLYAEGYADSQNWGVEYVRRAFQWYFERYRAPHLQMQIRRWDFSNFEASGEVSVQAYFRLVGTALTDPSGRYAHQLVAIPRSASSEVWFRFRRFEDGGWQIVHTNPAFPNFLDILSFSASPYESIPPGPDSYPRP